jgi:hypothetical protein
MRSSSRSKKIENPHKLLCLLCKTIASSCYYGEYSTCKCGAIGIDEDEVYIRIVGNRENYCEVECEPDTRN